MPRWGGDGSVWFRRRRKAFAARAIARDGSPGRQLNPAALLDLEQESAGGHVFELHGKVAPVPKLSQMLSDLAAAPTGMFAEHGAHLGQFRLVDRAALNDAMIVVRRGETGGI